MSITLFQICQLWKQQDARIGRGAHSASRASLFPPAAFSRNSAPTKGSSCVQIQTKTKCQRSARGSYGHHVWWQAYQESNLQKNYRLQHCSSELCRGKADHTAILCAFLSASSFLDRSHFDFENRSWPWFPDWTTVHSNFSNSFDASGVVRKKLRNQRVPCSFCRIGFGSGIRGTIVPSLLIHCMRHWWVGRTKNQTRFCGSSEPSPLHVKNHYCWFSCVLKTRKNSTERVVFFAFFDLRCLFSFQAMPPQSMPETPVNCVTTKFIRTSTNKIKCPIFCVCVSTPATLPDRCWESAGFIVNNCGWCTRHATSSSWWLPEGVGSHAVQFKNDVYIL